MQSVKEAFDVGPLSWVKAEIELGLQKADEGLARFQVNPTEQSLTRAALTHLHQVSGALLMVGLEPVARVSESVEKLVDAFDQGRVPPTGNAIGAARGGIAVLNEYLEGLMAGEVHQPLRLFPAYEAATVARGGEKPTPVDLFYPDLSIRPRFVSGADTRAGTALTALLQSKRTVYERGLLKLLRGIEVPQSLRLMRDTIASIEAAQPAETRTLWWAAVGFMEGLLAVGTAPIVAHKQICGRLDLQMKRQAEGAESMSERLLRELLFAVAGMPQTIQRIGEIQQTYRLSLLFPPPGHTNVDESQVRQALRELREPLEAVKESWLGFTSGNRGNLTLFAEQAAALRAPSGRLKHGALAALFAKIADIGAALKAKPRAADETLSLEMATALLVSKDALDNYQRITPEFASQIDAVTERLAAAFAGRPISNAHAPSLDEIARSAQEKLLFFQVGQEIQANLGHIEQVLDGFFRDPAKRAELPGLTAPLNQIQGAFVMLECDDAVNLLKTNRILIEKFGASSGPADSKDAELVADSFSNLGLYVTALQRKQGDADELLRPVLQRLGIAPLRPAEPLPMETPALPAPLEIDLDAQKRSLADLFDAWQREPQGAGHRSALTAALLGLRQDAALAGEADLSDAALRAASLLDKTDLGPAGAREVFATLLGALLPELPAKPASIVVASAAEIDAELLAVFLEEATEVLSGISIHLDVLRGQLSDREALTVIRRGFHTLKGSGRMVGLTELGEVAWQVEQVMNKWLREEVPASAGLLRLIEDAGRSFSEWVETLKAGAQPLVDAHHLIQFAELLKNDHERPETRPTAPIALVAVSAPAVVAASEVPSLELIVSARADSHEAAKSAPLEILASAGETSGELPTELIAIGEVMLDPSFFAIFTQEAAEHSATLGALKAQLATDPAAPITHEFMRAAHTLGGIARTTGFPAIAELGFALELWLQDRLQHSSTLSVEQVTLTSDAVNGLCAMVADVQARCAPQPHPEIVNRLEAELTRVRHLRSEEMEAAPHDLSAFANEAVASTKQVPPIEETEQPLPPQVVVEHAPSTAAAAELRPPAAVREIKPTIAPIHEATSSFAIHSSDPQESEHDEVQEAVAGKQEAPGADVVETGKERRVIVDDIDEELLPIFLEEAYELVPQVGDTLRDWRAQPSDKTLAMPLQRHLHTLKGSARMAGIMRLGELAHILENLVVAMQAKAEPSEQNFDELEESFDRFTTTLDRLKAGEREHAMLPAVAPALKVADDAALIAPEATPAVATVVPAPAEIDRRAVLRVRADLVDGFVNTAGEISIARSRVDQEMIAFRQGLGELTENVAKLRAQLREIEIQAETQIQSSIMSKQETGETFDPLEFDRFTRMQELTRFMAESVHDFITLQQSLTKNLDEADAALRSQARMNRELQQELMSVRMVPVSNLADRFYRILRRTAKDLGKKANLELRGMRTELDRSVLEKIIAPFEHLLRNAIAHGIEAPEERESIGKSAIGEIVIDARQQSSEVVLTIADDGRGIDLGRVREKAVAMELMAANSELADAQLIQFIFVPGFSTAEEVTQISGRGVGLDVVRSEIVALGGRVEVETSMGKGTTFFVTLPLTLAVTQAVLVYVHGRTYAIPSVLVEQVQELKLDQLQLVRAKREVIWQGRSYPYHALASLLGEEEKVGEVRRFYPLLLVRSGVQRLAIEVDDIEGNREIVVKSIGPQISRLAGIAGATVLGNGQVVLILNPALLIGRGEGPVIVRKVAAAVAVEPVKVAPLVMVVDDSLTVRKITGRLLAREGYRVVTAKDGVDALQQLQDITPDVMLLDIEMPRMDGFELTRNLRADAKTAHLPIIMITSRMAEKHRNYAQELGVNEYLGKPYQEEELLGHIARFTQREPVH
jgi:chemosensory pili system protein ChpA (sensor histidine kinase/response regulator)